MKKYFKKVDEWLEETREVSNALLGAFTLTILCLVAEVIILSFAMGTL